MFEKQNDYLNLLEYSSYVLARKKENKNAKRWYEIAVQQIKKNLELEKVKTLDEGEFIRRGELYKRIGMYEDARKEYEAALSLERESIDAKLGLCEVLYHSGKIDDSVKIINDLLHSHPESVKVLYRAGWILFNGRQYKESVEFLEKAKQKPDVNEDVLSLLGLAYFNLEDYKKSIECFEELVNQFPDSINSDIWRRNIEVLKNIKK